MTKKDFIDTFRQSLTAGTFVKLSLSRYQGSDIELKNIYIRKILVKRVEKLSFTYHYKTRDIVKNYDKSEALQNFADQLENGFQSAALFTTVFDLIWDKGQLKHLPPTHAEIPSLSHDRNKNRILSIKGKYLAALNITDDKGNILKSAQDKFRQIDKYVEILGGLIKNIPAEKIRHIVDMGAGKGYLTFALYDYLANTLQIKTKITGVEMRSDLVRLCNSIAKDSTFDQLRFVEGTIENYDARDANILIALHACDTATDDAIAKGIVAGAELIVVAPCCHKQIRREMEKSKISNDLGFLTRHGIFLERQAEMVTDGLRALILEYFGYHVKIFEFVAGEHTAKNIMIVAEKNSKDQNPALLEKIAQIKAYFGISRHYLEQLTHI